MELNKKIDEMKEELIKASQELVKIKSTEEEGKPGMPYGEGVAKTLDKALEISAALGFHTYKEEDGYYGYAEYGEGEEYVAVLGHMDVVPEGDNWIHPPYGAEIHDDKIFGRGTLDDKGPTMAALFGLKAIKDLNMPLSKKVRVIFGTNEETGSAEMHVYNKKEKAPVSGFTPDAMYPLINAEKGIRRIHVVKALDSCNSDVSVKSLKGGIRPNMVPDKCETVIAAKDTESIVKAVKEFADKMGYNMKAEIVNADVVLHTFGVSAHGSMPELGKNAVMYTLQFLGTIIKEDSALGSYVDFFNKNVGLETEGTSLKVACEDKPSGKLSLNVGVADINEEKADMWLDIRYPVTCKGEEIMNTLSEEFNKCGAKIERVEAQDPLYFAEDSKLVTTLLKVYTEQTGKEGKAYGIGGGTYAKELPNIIGFGPIFPGKPDLDHQANEYIEIEDLIMNAKIYAHTIYELAK
ncbi:dipeptidase PepV [Clostridium sp. P21]|uniref:Dipeptidase PepV n=1 Tax=Clostridium muellerianum TaxID=2716538 RepID=A0A7Y0EE41_9CLOT|nr:dipeptidase PepV [Clostridium muellerianum]NMM61826.1 dipeptidase PepV [Clostridium muellerianum]